MTLPWGVLVRLHELTLQVLFKSEELFNTEHVARKTIFDGIDPLEAYRQSGRF
jgi:hypothetical protein